ncbi:MAG: hypothetical protein K2X76_15800 [Sphingomonas sp.]|nr:hypothetical protein [Sphingomonas sp.]
MNLELILIRIDPVSRTIVPMKLRIGRDATRKMRQMLGAKTGEQIGWHQLIDVELTSAKDGKPEASVPLIAAGLLDRDEGAPTWRLRGLAEHSGIGMLFGRGPGGGMVSVPVNKDWVEKRIIWSEGTEP